MKRDVPLTITSLLSLLLASLHMAEDVVRGFEPGGFQMVTAILIMALWLYGTLALGDRRSGHVIILLGALLGCVIPLAHMRGAGMVGGRIVGSSGVLLWVWTLFAVGATSLVSLVLSAQGLWRLRKRSGGGA
jgi:hypothetical protein